MIELRFKDSDHRAAFVAAVRREHGVIVCSVCAGQGRAWEDGQPVPVEPHDPLCRPRLLPFAMLNAPPRVMLTPEIDAVLAQIEGIPPVQAPLVLDEWRAATRDEVVL